MVKDQDEECLEELMESLERTLQRDAANLLWDRYYRLKNRRFVLLRYLRMKWLLKKIRLVIGCHGDK